MVLRTCIKPCPSMEATVRNTLLGLLPLGWGGRLTQNLPQLHLPRLRHTLTTELKRSLRSAHGSSPESHPGSTACDLFLEQDATTVMLTLNLQLDVELAKSFQSKVVDVP